jgi:pimeloyl-ACP methyl ester carboxylesterase
MASRLFVPGVLVLDPFDNLAVVEATEIPILVLHGERDDVIPIHHGEELARAAGTELIRMPCGHNDCARPIETVLRFLEEQQLK